MYKYVKRVLDIIISFFSIPLIALSTIIVGIFIKLEDRGPVFYLADRIGKNGKIFKMYKYRSMKVNAPDIRLEDGSTFNSEKDDRVTKVGKIIRKFSIDEIPQLLNVLKGDMSLVGPRPDSAMWLNNYTEEEKVILKVRPGITGYNQVVSRNFSNTKEKLKNDIYYVEHISLGFDVKILFKTIGCVVFSKNINRNIDINKEKNDGKNDEENNDTRS